MFELERFIADCRAALSETVPQLAIKELMDRAVSRPTDRWIEGLAMGGRLVFPLGAPGPQRPNSGGRHSDRGAAQDRTARRRLCGAGGQHGLFCLRRGRIRG